MRARCVNVNLQSITQRAGIMPAIGAQLLAHVLLFHVLFVNSTICSETAAGSSIVYACCQAQAMCVAEGLCLHGGGCTQCERIELKCTPGAAAILLLLLLRVFGGVACVLINLPICTCRQHGACDSVQHRKRGSHPSHLSNIVEPQFCSCAPRHEAACGPLHAA